MSALTDLFTSMANKIRSKTGTATTYTPSEMASDGIDDVYDAGVASATTSITPSNASPVAMSANTGYKPTTAGYAISSYNSITPSDISPATLYANGIYKIGGNGGKAVEDISGLMPSNSSPASVVVGKVYQATGAGKAIASYSSVTPSNYSPATLSSGSIYKMDGSGKAVASVTSKTPSDSSPASVTANSIIQPTAAGYLVENVPIALYNPDVTWQGNISANGTKSITVTKTPRLVIHTFARYGDNSGYSATRINDVANNKHASAWYLGSYNEELNTSGLAGLTVSSTSITVDPGRNYTTRNLVFVFY